MEIKKIEKCDYVMFPRLQEQGIEFKHVEREAFRAELKHVKGHGDFWLVYQQAPPQQVLSGKPLGLIGYNSLNVLWCRAEKAPVLHKGNCRKQHKKYPGNDHQCKDQC